MERKARLHPLVGFAAISVIGVSLTGIAVLTGLLPHPSAAPSQPGLSAPSPATAALVSAASADPVKLPPALETTPEPARPAPQRPKAALQKRAPATAAPVAIAAASEASAAGAATPPPPPTASPAHETAPAAVAVAPAPACHDCGTVENFRQVEVKGDGSPAGAIAGGAAGALLGRQFGRGSGKDLLTIAGAVGGAFAGHEVEKRVRTKTRYEISVRMEDGSLRTLSQESAPAWRIGERVRVVDNRVVASS